MTDLTEKWKKGELPEDFYYAKCPWCDEVDIRYIHNGVDDYEDIIMPVPSYEEWQALNQNLDSTMQTNKALCEELAEVKELLRIILSKTQICYSMVFQKDIINAELNEALLKKIKEVLK